MVVVCKKGLRIKQVGFNDEVIIHKYISRCINYVWINRIEIKRADEWSFVIFNKWNGNHCVFHTAKMGRKNKRVLTQFNNCIVNEYGKINLP
jgi:hypothetical protein